MKIFKLNATTVTIQLAMKIWNWNQG